MGFRVIIPKERKKTNGKSPNTKDLKKNIKTSTSLKLRNTSRSLQMCFDTIEYAVVWKCVHGDFAVSVICLPHFVSREYEQFRRKKVNNWKLGFFEGVCILVFSWRGFVFGEFFYGCHFSKIFRFGIFSFGIMAPLRPPLYR